MTFIIAVNFKMNKTFQEIEEYFSNFKKDNKNNNKEIIFFPQTIHLEKVSNITKDTDLKVGIQNIFYEEEGAFTGENSINTLNEIGIKYSLIGHSERRNIFGETNQNINKKIKLCLKNNITPILCIGDNIKKELELGLKGIDDYSNIIIGFEPISAIGSGESASYEYIKNSHKIIRDIVGKNIKIMYGGSVNQSNFEKISQIDNVDGVLIGKYGLDVNNILKVIK